MSHHQQLEILATAQPETSSRIAFLRRGARIKTCLKHSETKQTKQQLQQNNQTFDLAPPSNRIGAAVDAQHLLLHLQNSTLQRHQADHLSKKDHALVINCPSGELAMDRSPGTTHMNIICGLSMQMPLIHIVQDEDLGLDGSFLNLHG